MASAKASVMGVRLQVLLIITSPPVGETVNFQRKRATSLYPKTRMRRFVIFFFSSIRLRAARAVSHQRRHERHCGLQMTPFLLHETRSRVNKHLREFNDFSTICGKMG